MGINKLNATINRECKHLVDDAVPISQFAGLSVAVDIDIPVHKCHSVEFEKASQRITRLDQEINVEKVAKKTISSVMKWISRHFVQNGVKPVIIFGGAPPEAKLVYTAPKRKKPVNKAKKQLKEYKESLATVEKLNVEQVDTMDDILNHTRELPKGFNQQLYEALESKGYPRLRAVSEAEELCTKLCRDGHVGAVYSTDTDNILRRCPMLITKLTWSKEDGSLIATVYRYTEELPHSLGFSYETFVDYCIMMGCDYNHRVDGMRESDIIEYLLYYGSIEAIEQGEGVDLSILNYQECRLLLTERPLEQCCDNMEELSYHFDI